MHPKEENLLQFVNEEIETWPDAIINSTFHILSFIELDFDALSSLVKAQ